MPIEKLQRAVSLEAERIEALKQLIPEAVADGKIKWDSLKEALGETLEDESPDAEDFGLFWPGKREARKLAAKPSKGTLVPVPGEGVEEDSTENIFIEGDNLEVLKLLQKSYTGRIKMIYIDPPYNTGNDFIYKDDFKEPLDAYLRKTKQKDDEGTLLTTNTKTDGRFHSNWLNMMYPRLRLARNLLRDDGVIFVSIDDNEVHNLRQLMNEIFGEENFIAEFVWKCRQFPDARAVTKVSTDHEYLLVYSRSSQTSMKGIERDESKFSNPDKDPRGDWMSRSLLGLANAEQRPNLHYEIVEPESGRRFSPPSNTGWRYSIDRMNALIANNCILFPTKPDGRPREKKFRADLLNDLISFPSIIDGVHTSQGTAEIREFFGFQAIDFPKPVELIKRITSQVLITDDIVLDFFAGSGTTAQAVMELNKQDGGNRKFILVQLPEETNLTQFKTIAEITKERIRRSIKKLKDKDSGKLQMDDVKLDLGFKVFKLEQSSFRQWQDYRGEDLPGLHALMEG